MCYKKKPAELIVHFFKLLFFKTALTELLNKYLLEVSYVNIDKRTWFKQRCQQKWYQQQVLSIYLSKTLTSVITLNCTKKPVFLLVLIPLGLFKNLNKPRKASSTSGFNFSTLYTKIPRNKLVKVLK